MKKTNQGKQIPLIVYGLSVNGKKVTHLASGRTFDLAEQRYDWLADFLTDPASLAYILQGMAGE